MVMPYSRFISISRCISTQALFNEHSVRVNQVDLNATVQASVFERMNYG